MYIPRYAKSRRKSRFASRFSIFEGSPYRLLFSASKSFYKSFFEFFLSYIFKAVAALEMKMPQNL